MNKGVTMQCLQLGYESLSAYRWPIGSLPSTRMLCTPPLRTTLRTFTPRRDQLVLPATDRLLLYRLSAALRVRNVYPPPKELYCQLCWVSPRVSNVEWDQGSCPYPWNENVFQLWMAVGLVITSLTRVRSATVPSSYFVTRAGKCQFYIYCGFKNSVC
jgi:hypothetical protein